jgi:hypothetical protein
MGMELLLQQNLEETILLSNLIGQIHLWKVVYPDARFLLSETTGEMAFLNKIVGVTKWEEDTSTGNYKYKMWELK